MCFSNGQNLSRIHFLQLLDIELPVPEDPLFRRNIVNGFDFGPTAVIRLNPQSSTPELTTMEWGFIPHPDQWPFWETREQVKIGRVPHRDSRGNFVDGLNFLNAVSEELIKPGKVFRQAARLRPCLFISTGYYEWRHIYPRNKRTGALRKTALKYPYRVFLRGRDYFFIAGIWQEWMDADTGEVIDTAAMVTTEANEIAAQIHNSRKRQPSVLSEELAYKWLFSQRSDALIDQIARFQIPAAEMNFYTLAKNFQSADDPLKHVEYQELSPIGSQGKDEAGLGQLSLF